MYLSIDVNICTYTHMCMCKQLDTFLLCCMILPCHCCYGAIIWHYHRVKFYDRIQYLCPVQINLNCKEETKKKKDCTRFNIITFVFRLAISEHKRITFSNECLRLICGLYNTSDLTCRKSYMKSTQKLSIVKTAHLPRSPQIVYKNYLI